MHFRDGLDPTIEFRGLTIQNAPWAASKAPFIHAGRIALTVSWRTPGLRHDRHQHDRADDAQVDMERLADGIRNWRITRPDDVGPPRVRVLALDARNSSLHTIHRGIDLELDAQHHAARRARSRSPGIADLPLTKRLVFKGRLQGRRVRRRPRASATC